MIKRIFLLQQQRRYLNHWEVRNWDYRFCWIRDASMVIKVMSLGHKNIAKRYLKFIINLMPDKDEKLQIMYGINGEKKLTKSF